MAIYWLFPALTQFFVERTGEDKRTDADSKQDDGIVCQDGVAVYQVLKPIESSDDTEGTQQCEWQWETLEDAFPGGGQFADYCFLFLYELFFFLHKRIQWCTHTCKYTSAIETLVERVPFGQFKLLRTYRWLYAGSIEHTLHFFLGHT